MLLITWLVNCAFIYKFLSRFEYKRKQFKTLDILDFLWNKFPMWNNSNFNLLNKYCRNISFTDKRRHLRRKNSDFSLIHKNGSTTDYQ